MKNKVSSLIAEGILFCGSGILLLSYSLKMCIRDSKESLKKDLSLESIETFFNSRDPEERDEENSITYEAEVDGKRIL